MFLYKNKKGILTLKILIVNKFHYIVIINYNILFTHFWNLRNVENGISLFFKLLLYCYYINIVKKLSSLITE